MTDVIPSLQKRLESCFFFMLWVDGLCFKFKFVNFVLEKRKSQVSYKTKHYFTTRSDQLTAFFSFPFQLRGTIIKKRNEFGTSTLPYYQSQRMY